MAKYSDVTPFEILVMVAIIYASYKIAYTFYPILFRRYDDKILNIEKKLDDIKIDETEFEQKIEKNLEVLNDNLKQELRDVVTEMRSLVSEMRTYVTETEVLKTKLRSLEKRVDRLEKK